MQFFFPSAATRLDAEFRFTQLCRQHHTVPRERIYAIRYRDRRGKPRGAQVGQRLAGVPGRPTVVAILETCGHYRIVFSRDSRLEHVRAGGNGVPVRATYFDDRGADASYG
jgi:hypothetical protein